MRAAIYVRVSTDQDAQKRSPENQIATCREYAADNAMETAQDLVYNDAGLSGTEMEHRAEVRRMVADARAGKFDVVVFTAISRFARDLADALNLKKKLESIYGIRIVSVEEGYDTAIEGRNSEMIFTVFAMLAAHKSSEMSKAIRRGLRQSARQGRHIGNTVPFGYRKTHDKKLVPDPHTASIIKEIFHLYLTGLGSNAIADELNRRHVPTATASRGKGRTLWQASTVSAVLRNPVYVGTLVANKWRKATDIQLSRQFDAKIKRQMVRAKDEWVVIKNSHEAILNEDTFDAVQSMMAAKAKTKGVARSSNTLSGLMRCVNCGGAMIVSSSRVRGRDYKYIVCATRRRIGKSACTNQWNYRYHDVLNAVIDPLKTLSIGQDALELWVQHVVDASLDSNIRERMADLKRRIKHNQNRQRETLRAFTDGAVALEFVKEHQQELQYEAKQLADQFAALESECVTHDELEDKRDELRRLLHVVGCMNQFDAVTVRTVLGILIDRIELSGQGVVRVIYQWDQTDFGNVNTSLMS